MTTETRKRIRAYKKALPELRERVVAVALLLAMSVSMLASASFAWITLSAAPEATGMQTTVAANGNLEIALAQGSTQSAAVAPGESQVGDSSAAEDQTIVGANVTWGNLVNVSDPTYGLDKIALRPALLSAYNRTDYPLNGATYGGDGRVVTTNDRYEFASYTKIDGQDGFYFAAGDKVKYGVRAISSVGYANVTAGGRTENFSKDTIALYQNAQNYYGLIVAEKPNDVNTLNAGGVTCITALQGLVTVFAQDKINEMGYGYGKGNPTSCSGYIWYLKEMLLRLQTALQKEGLALLELANWQAYLAYEENPTDKTFATIDDVIAASNQTITVDGKTTTVLASKGVNISTLESYKDSIATIDYCLNGKGTDADPGLLYMASKCENPDAPEVDYYWDDIDQYVNKLVDINTTTMNGKKLSDINGIGDAMDIMGGGDVIVYNGELKDIESRFVDDTNRVYANVVVTVYVNYMFIDDMDVEGVVYTVARGKEPEYTADLAYSEGLESSDKGEVTAKDTYGLALDLWVRTNYPDAVLTLEGSAKYEDQPATITIEGTVYDLYTITVGNDEVQTEADVYQKDNTWYYASTMEEVPSDDMGSQTPEQKYIAVIVGYEGENRVWEDWRELLEGGYIEQDATTQGAGSCFVFYADTPTEQAKIMELLEAFNVAFMDQSGTILATAKLNIASAYANQGKVTVPLEVDTGTDYTDESGATHAGITRLAQNTPTMITAIVYLNGSKLQNENVLAEGELQGQLNIQFGTSATLIAPDNEELQAQARTITAAVTVNGETVTNGTIGGTEGLEYKEDGYKATVTLTVEGEQPERISGFFVRVINSTQGTRGEEQYFKQDAEDPTKWVAEFTLTNPGTYAFNTLMVDGMQYTLHDGSEQSGMNSYYDPNRPYVYIKGLKVVSASVNVTPGTHMTANSSMEFPVSVKIESAVTPKQVNAQFFSDDNSKQYTAILTYDATNQQWVGSANISSSDTYTLKYITVDGVPMDAPATGSYTLYLGLTARVSTTVPAADWTYVYTGAAVQLPMRVYVYDDTHNLIPNLSGMELHYTNMLSPAAMTWTGKYYEGTLDATNAGEMTFKEIVLGNNIGTIRTVSSAPVFEARNVNPVDYVVNSGTVKFGEKVTVGDSTPDEMTVLFTDGQTADVWAVMTNSYANRTEIIPGVRNNSNDQNEVTFYVPIDSDGEWVLTQLRLQDCFDDQGNEYPVTGSDPTESDSLIFNLTAEEQAVMKSKIYATYNVSVTIGDTVKSYKSTDNKSVETVTVNLTPEEAGTFLQGHETGDIIVEITNYEDDPFGIVSADKTALQIQHDKDTTWDYGKYTGATGDKIDFTASVSNGTVTFSGMTLNHAGVYKTNTFNVNIGGSAVPIKVQPKYEISSKSPTVTVTGVSPHSSGHSTVRIYTTQTPSNASNMIEGSFTTFNKYTSNSAVAYVYVLGGDLGWFDQEAATPYQPRVSLQLTGIPTTATASMLFEHGTNSTYNTIFNFAVSEKVFKATSGVGGFVNGTSNDIGTSDYPEIYPGGLMTQNQITVTYGGIDYTVGLTDTITINNPLYPISANFASIAATDSTFKGTDVSTENIYTTDGETITLTMPSADSGITMSWTTNESSSVDGTFAQVGDATTRTVYTQEENGVMAWNDWRTAYRFIKYTETKTMYQATSSTTTWVNTHSVIGWKIGNNSHVYLPGEQVTITSKVTIVPVISIVEGQKTTQKTTGTYYTYAYTETARVDKARSVPSGYGTKVNSAANYTTETTYS